jgi:hypothetical protein
MSSQRATDHGCAGGFAQGLHNSGMECWRLAARIAILFLGVACYAKVNRQWSTNLPKQIYLQACRLTEGERTRSILFPKRSNRGDAIADGSRLRG